MTQDSSAGQGQELKASERERRLKEMEQVLSDADLNKFWYAPPHRELLGRWIDNVRWLVEELCRPTATPAEERELEALKLLEECVVCLTYTRPKAGLNPNWKGSPVDLKQKGLIRRIVDFLNTKKETQDARR